MRLAFKLFSSIYLVIIFTIVSLITLVFYRDPKQRLDRISRNTAMFSPILLWIMDIRFKVKDHTHGRALNSGALVVANHVSYVDVFIMAALRPMLFISSVELSRKPFVGHVSRLGGTVFVERRKYTNLRKEIDNVTSVLKHDFVVTLFPEARTSEGVSVLPFKGALFEAAVKSGADVVPVCFRYLSVGGKPVTTENKDIVFYHSGHKFVPHIIKLFMYNDIEVEIELFPRISTQGKTRKQIVQQSYGLISRSYAGGPPDYHA